MHALNPFKISKVKDKTKGPSSSNKKEKLNKNTNSIKINLEPEENILHGIIANRLHPPPIGTFSKDLKFDTTLNFSVLSPVFRNNEKVILGDGSFSIVQLYENKKTKVKYAVKKMNSEKIEKITKNKNLINTEVNIHGRITHPNIIKLHNFFTNKNMCFLILEYAPNKTLFDIIRASRGLSEIYSFYYFLQTLNAIYFLHLHSIIHRDLKPENLLINEKNIIKLCDFGWSVKLDDNKRTTFCGTVEYMAPEIIKKEKYDESIDIWSLGVLLYELVHSYSPFYSEDLDVKTIGNNITNNNLSFKEGLSHEYKNLVENLLIKDSNKRIKIEDIFQHPFMIKYINMIYQQVNNKNKIIKKNINNTNTKAKKKKLIKINITQNEDLSDNEDTLRDTYTNAIFESIPNEPIAKILPPSNLLNNEIKKIKTNFLNIDANAPDSNLNTSRDKLKDEIGKIIKKENKKIKSQNRIAHVKSFSLGQNDPTFKDLNENRLKIIISINNTQNKNYINKNKNRNKDKNLYVQHKKSLSNNFQDNFIGYNSNLSIYNKIYPMQQLLNYENKNNNISSKNHKSINSNAFNYNTNSNKDINNNKLFNNNEFDNNYVKNDNNSRYQYISMINTNNTNNYSNIIINNNENSPNIKKMKHGRNKGLKISNSNYRDLKYLCRVNSDSNKNIFKNNQTKNNTNNNIRLSSNKKKSKKINTINILNNKNLFQTSIENIDKSIKVSFIDKILSYNNKDLIASNNKTEIKKEEDIVDVRPNLKKNLGEIKNHLNLNINQNSNKNEKIIKK